PHRDRPGPHLQQASGAHLTAAGQVAAVGRGGEPAVGHPHQPAQPPPTQVVLDRADDRLIGGVPGEGPAPHRHAVAGDRHRDHHLRQIRAVVLGVPERPHPRLGRAGVLVVGDRVGEVEVGEVRRVLEEAPSVVVYDDPAEAKFPTPVDATGTDPTWVGRIRRALDD
ncbi:MAG: hypothetical protein GEV00_24400, partial [Actinophytocola sp.]|nr:hypothetical protein [Actinophytocola sp.]